MVTEFEALYRLTVSVKMPKNKSIMIVILLTRTCTGITVALGAFAREKSDDADNSRIPTSNTRRQSLAQRGQRKSTGTAFRCHHSPHLFRATKGKGYVSFSRFRICSHNHAATSVVTTHDRSIVIRAKKDRGQQVLWIPQLNHKTRKLLL